jgi:hypothetical protein
MHWQRLGAPFSVNFPDGSLGTCHDIPVPAASDGTTPITDKATMVAALKKKLRMRQRD